MVEQSIAKAEIDMAKTGNMALISQICSKLRGKHDLYHFLR